MPIPQATSQASLPAYCRLTYTQTKTESYEIYKGIWQLAIKAYGNQHTQLVRFHRKFVRQFKWLSQSQYRQIQSLCWILPGPTLIQVMVTIVTLKLKSLSAGFLAFLLFSLPSWFLLFVLSIISKSYLYDTTNLPTEVILLLFGFNAASIGIIMKSFITHFLEHCRSLSKCILIFSSTIIFLQYQSISCIVFCLLFGSIVSLYMKFENHAKTMSQKSTALLSHVNFSPWFGRRSLFLLIFFYLIGWVVSSVSSSRLYFYAYSFYFTGFFIIGPVSTLFAYFLGIFLPNQTLSEQQLWLGIPFAFLLPGSIINVGIYFGGLIDGIRGSFLAAMCLYLPCFLSLYGILPQWAKYRNKSGIQRLTVGITCITTGLILAVILSLRHCMATDQSMTICIFLTAIFMNYVWKIYPFIILLICGLLANFRRWGLIYYRVLPDHSYSF